MQTGNDLVLLKVLTDRSNYESYIDLVNVHILESEMRKIILALRDYYQETENNSVDLNTFKTWFIQGKYPNLSTEEREIYETIINRAQEVPTEDVEIVVRSFLERTVSQKLIEICDNKFDIEKLQSALEQYERDISRVLPDDKDMIENDLTTILESTKRGEGLEWRLDCLNNAIGPLNRGKFIIVAAYVDVGKTSFAISEATHMARQMHMGNVLWLNNEEDDYRVLRKIWKSTLGCGDHMLSSHPDKCESEFRNRMHGDLNRIKMINIRNKSFREIKKLFDKYKPSLCVIDQVDKIANGKFKAFSDHDRLKNLYGEVRGLANEYCPIIAISQADVTTVKLDKETGDIDYQLYPHHRQLDGSKVGKPGEADAIIMIGRRSDSPNTRGLHVSKNKFGDIVKQEVVFNGAQARYENP